MLVVADASPLIVLANIQSIDILPKPVRRSADTTTPGRPNELRQHNRSQPVQDFISNPPPWLIEQSARTTHSHENLDPRRDKRSISLAEELRADLLLIDEMKGRRVAAARRLTLTGTIGVLELAAARQLVDLKDAFDRIKQTDFWISHDLLDQRLRSISHHGGQLVALTATPDT